MLRKLRIAAAVVCFALVTLLFLDFTARSRMVRLAGAHPVPAALLAVNVGVVAALVVATLLFGRVYCSVVCPLGVMQDGVSWGGGQTPEEPLPLLARENGAALHRAGPLHRRTRRRHRLTGRTAGPVQRLRPHRAEPAGSALGWGNNLLAYFAERIDSYAFYRTDVWVRSAATFAVAAATFALIAVLAWRNGRTWCNTVCPVGTVLGFLARFSLLRPAIDTEKCVGCNRCARNCKASCIDVEHHRIDYSRCVVCMDCIDTCHKNAIAYDCGRKPASRRRKRRESREERRTPPVFRAAVFCPLRAYSPHTRHSVHRRSSPTAGWPSSNRKKFPAVRRRSSRPAPRACATWRTTAPAASSAWPSVPTACCGPRKNSRP